MSGNYPLYVGASLFNQSQAVGMGTLELWDVLNEAWKTVDIYDGSMRIEGLAIGGGGGSGDMVLASVQTVTGAKTFNDSTLLLRNVANTFSSKFTNTNTAARTYTLPNSTGTVALTSDIGVTVTELDGAPSALCTSLVFPTGAVSIASGVATLVVANASHVHGNILNDGRIGSTENLPLITTTGGVITVGSFGTSANTFCQGNDARLSDARTPLTHVHDGADITTGLVDPTRLGSGSGISTKFLRGDSTWQTISGGGGGGGSTPTDITVANEATDTTCFLAFFTAATGDLGPKTNGSLTYNSATSSLACTTFVGVLTGNASTVTTNANLTGHVTSTGNATVLGSFTKDQLDGAVSDGNVLYVGDVTSNATHTGDVTGSTALTIKTDVALAGNPTTTTQAATDNSTRIATTEHVKAATSRLAPFKIDTTTTGAKKLYYPIPFACTITGWEMVADVSGSVVVDIWKDTYANYPPAVGDTITGSAKPTITTATKAQSSTLTGWTTSLAAGDYLEVNVDSVTTITNVTLTLIVTRT